MNYLSWVDYLIFGIMLGLSAAIGLFYGCTRKMTQIEYSMAGKSMDVLPVSLSLLSSFTSAVAYIGISSETYERGFIYVLYSLGYFIITPVTAYLYLPVFWKLQLTSTNEYLRKRFCRPVQLIGSFLLIAQMMLYMSLIIYGPALAVSQVAGIHVYISVFLVSFVCILYTTAGGLKAVIWSDALQMSIMFIAIITIVVKGTIDEGGFYNVWTISTMGNRTDIEWNIDPRVRHSVWSLIIGGTFVWMPLYAVHQAQIQRYLCVREKHMAEKALWICTAGLIVIVFICSFSGLLMYSKYKNCDPIKSGQVTKADQLLPYYVLDTFSNWPGITGLFMAGLFSGSLSSVSTGINSLAVITMEDFVKIFYPVLQENRSVILSRFFTVAYGLFTIALIFLIEKLGSLAAAGMAANGIIGGPMLGLFTLGMFVPWANSIGAVTGVASSLILVTWISLGHQSLVVSGEYRLPNLPVQSCNGTSYYTSLPENLNTHSFIEEIYKISYLYYSLISFLCTVIVGGIVSLFKKRKNVNPDLLSPLVWRNLKIKHKISTISHNGFDKKF